jgi:hypothetical protein
MHDGGLYRGARRQTSEVRRRRSAGKENIEIRDAREPQRPAVREAERQEAGRGADP